MSSSSHNKKIYCQLLKNLLPSTQDTTLFIRSNDQLTITNNRTSNSNYIKRKVSRILANPTIERSQQKTSRCDYLKNKWNEYQC